VPEICVLEHCDFRPQQLNVFFPHATATPPVATEILLSQLLIVRCAPRAKSVIFDCVVCCSWKHHNNDQHDKTIEALEHYFTQIVSGVSNLILEEFKET